MVYAAGVNTTATDPLANSGLNTLKDVFGLIINVVLGVGIALTIIYLILGGIKYVMSQGDPKNTQVAREWLTNAVIGFIVVIGAFVIRTIVANVLGGGGNLNVGNVTP